MRSEVVVVIVVVTLEAALLLTTITREIGIVGVLGS